MTLFEAKKVADDSFMSTFKFQGQVYHLVGSLLPETGQFVQFLQIYFVGKDEKKQI